MHKLCIYLCIYILSVFIKSRPKKTVLSLRQFLLLCVKVFLRSSERHSRFQLFINVGSE